MRPRGLDLFCGAGGASRGYADAGFDMTGVDLVPQKHYPYPFIQADAVSFSFIGYDFVHASPPCQPDSRMSNCRPGVADTYDRLIKVTRARLEEWGGPWVLENVVGSEVAAQLDLFGAEGLTLCGHMFGLPLYRHRLFEASFPLPSLHHPRHETPASKAGHWEPGTIISVAGHCGPASEVKRAMGISWMTVEEMSEAIPPAYSEYLGGLALKEVTRSLAG